MKKTLCCVSLAILVLSAFSQTQTLPARIDMLLTAYTQQHIFNGSALVARKGAVLFEKGYGFKNGPAKAASLILYQNGRVIRERKSNNLPPQLWTLTYLNDCIPKD